MLSMLSCCTAALALGLVARPLAAQQPEEPVDSSAVRLIHQLRDGQYAAVEASFDSTMQQALPEMKLRQTWEQVLSQVGALRHLGMPRRSSAGGYTIIIVPATFERAVLDARVVFDSGRRVSGLFFQPHVEEHPAPPPYADSSSYTERPLMLGSGDGALPGTLTLPRGSGPFPAVVLVHGSGPNDRDESVGGIKVFRDLALGLASRGIAVYRYEKRTRAHPEEFRGVFTVDQETVNDAIAAAELLRHTPGIDSKRVFVLGHSLGGMMAPRIGWRDRALAGLIIMAGTTRPLEDVMAEQLDYLRSVQSDTAGAGVMARMREGIARVRALTPADSASTRPVLGAPPAYWLDLHSYYPVGVAGSIRMRMLILQGRRDYQVTMKDFANWRRGLNGDPHVTFKVYPTLNHLFVAGTGKSTPAEYAKPGHVAGEVVSDIAKWIKRGKR